MVSENVTGTTGISTTQIINTLIPVFTFILGLLGKLVYDFWHDNYVERKKRREKSLFNHYNNIDNVISQLENKLISTRNNLGQIVTTAKIDDDQGGETTIEMDISNPSWSYFQGENSTEFLVHFPKQRDSVSSFLTDALTHNENLIKFEQELYSDLSKSIDLNTTSVRISTRLPKILREELCIIVKESKETKRDGLDSDISKDLVGRNQIIKREGKFQVHSTGRFFIETEQEQTAKDFIDNLKKIQDSDTLVLKMNEFYENATKISRKAQILVRQLKTIRKQYLEFGKILKRKKECPTCKLIYD